jgi:2-polyprenyl-3-methyl-5-hydroxy-6-metoxy-1,4-benzoquinol methylase
MNSFQDNKNLYFEQIGENFDRYMSQYDVDRRAFIIQDIIMRRLLKSFEMRALETGCGTGRITATMQKLFKTYTVSDLSIKLSQAVSDKYGCRFEVIDLSIAKDCERHQGFYDIAISSEVIEHTPDPALSIANTLKMIAGGGYVLLTTPNKLWMPVLFLANIFRLRRFQGNETWLWPNQITRVLEENGFQIVEKRGCHLFPWQIPFAKLVLPYIDKCGRYLYPFMINFVVLAKDTGRKPQ